MVHDFSIRLRRDSAVHALPIAALEQAMRIRLRARRGTAARRLDALEHLRFELCAVASPEEVIRGATRVAASAFGDYCVADQIDRRGASRRIAIAHPDDSRLVRLDVAVALARKESAPNARIERLLETGSGELMPRVTSTYRARALADVALLSGETVRSYMASIVSTGGAPIAVLTLARVYDGSPYRRDEHAFLDTLAAWTGLAMENALRRERSSGAPTGRFPPLRTVAHSSLLRKI